MLYDYSRTRYINRIEIICPIHGLFFQRPSSHLGGSGCPTCRGKLYYPSEKLFETFKNIYGDKYNIKSIFIGKSWSPETICFICKVHGETHRSLKEFQNDKLGCSHCVN